MGMLSGDFYSESLRITQHLNVIVPDRSEDFWTEVDDEVRVLYLLHGLGSNADEWPRFSMIEAFAKIYDFAVIMPDGNRSFYENIPAGPRYLDWVAYELPSLIHTWFRLPEDRAHTFIAGEKHGGYGALRVAFERPEVFAGVAALSAVTDPMALPSEFPDLLWGDEEARSVFGDQGPCESDSIASHARTSIERYGAASMPFVLQMVGTEDPFCSRVCALSGMLSDMGLRSSFESWHGRHDFLFWNKAIERAMKTFCGLNG